MKRVHDFTRDWWNHEVCRRIIKVEGMLVRRIQTSCLSQRIRGARCSSTEASSNANAGATRSFSAHLDYKRMRSEVDSIAANMRQRNMASADTTPHLVASLYDRRVAVDHEAAQLRRDRNAISAQIAKAMKLKDGANADRLKLEAAAKKDRIALLEHEIAQMDAQLFEEAKHLPNDTCPSVPVGAEEMAEILDVVGTPATPTNKTRSHLDLCDFHAMADFARASKVSGSGFYFLKNFGALLELALSRYAVDTCVQEHGFTPICTPDIIRHEVLEACGFSPRADAADPQTYFLSTHLDTQHFHAGFDPLRLCLAATAEFPLAAMHAGEVLQPAELPIKYVGLGRAFRAEGLAGGANRGLYRVHQFSKVEMFGIVAGGASGGLERSLAMMEEFKDIQMGLFEGLEICFRILNMPTEELGAPAYKKYDMEAWMPGRNTWGEISSTSNCTDYQSRRLNIRNFPLAGSTGTSPGVKKDATLDFVHTINGTAAAIPRLIIALLETHQRENGDVIIPERLRPYVLGGQVEVVKAGETLQQVVARTKKTPKGH